MGSRKGTVTSSRQSSSTLQTRFSWFVAVATVLPSGVTLATSGMWPASLPSTFLRRPPLSWNTAAWQNLYTPPKRTIVSPSALAWMILLFESLRPASET